ncbi:hypothetical protein B4Q13_17525 [Lacticaseibacillus rhamnosus]
MRQVPVANILDANQVLAALFAFKKGELNPVIEAQVWRQPKGVVTPPLRVDNSVIILYGEGHPKTGPADLYTSGSLHKSHPLPARPAGGVVGAALDRRVVGHDRHPPVLMKHVDRHALENFRLLRVLAKDIGLGAFAHHGLGRQHETVRELLDRHLQRHLLPGPEAPDAEILA